MSKDTITLDTLLANLETAKQMAIDDRHVTGIITATMAQAKLCGLDKGEVITVNHNQTGNLKVEFIDPDEFRKIALEVLEKV